MEKSKNMIYKPTVKTSQMQSCQKTLTSNCATKAGRIKLLPRFRTKVQEHLVQAEVMDDVEQNTLDRQWAKKLVKDKTGDVTGQDSD